MVKYLKNDQIEKIALRIVIDLKKFGYKETYFVGGIVRDKLLDFEFENSIDIDIATEARPDEIKEVFKNEKFLEIGEAFNIIIIIIKGHKFEIATFREDIFEINKAKWNGRYPKKVTYATAEDDAKRRDFTINAIFYDPVEKKHFDFVNGIPDIKNKIIRTIGIPEERFREDYLRMLRAVRFAVQKNFTIVPEVMKAIKMNADKIISISKERVLIELNKIFSSADPSEGLNLLNESNLLKWIYFYDKKKRDHIVIDPHYLEFTSKCLSNKYRSLLINWVIFFQFLHLYVKDISDIKNILIDNKFDNKTIGNIIWILQNKDLLINWNRISDYKKMEFVIHPQFENLFLFYKIEAETNNNLTCHSQKQMGIGEDNFSLINTINSIDKFYRLFRSDKIKWGQMNKFTVINGNDLIKIGVKGKKIGELLNKIKKKFILEELKNKEDIIKFLHANK